MNRNLGLVLVILVLVSSCKMNGPKKESATNVEVPPNAFVIHTSFGDMKGRLYDETPLHRDNFIKLVNEGFYDSLLFHRVIRNFMIQGGDPDSKYAPKGKMLGDGGPGYTIPAEFNPQFIHKKGALAAARMGDNVNPKKESSGSQFYIVEGAVYDSLRLVQMEKKLMGRKTSKHIYDYLQLPENIDLKFKLDSLRMAKNNEALIAVWKDTKVAAEEYYKGQDSEGFSDLQKKTYTSLGGTPHLDGAYTVFGEIYEGLNIIDSIANVKSNRSNRPLKDVVFTIEMIKK